MNYEDYEDEDVKCRCFDCVNWKGWSCEGKCEYCINNSNFEENSENK